MLETVAAYWTRKHEELAFLAGAARTELRRVSTGNALWHEKQRLRAALQSRVIGERPQLTESQLHANPPPDDELPQLAWAYQRFDLRVRTRRFFETVYPLDVRGGISLGVWAASGMGVITATLRTLHDTLRAPRRILFADDAYFETRKLLSRLERFLPNADDDALLPGDFFYLDSVTDADHFPRLAAHASLAALQLVLFDTTCYDVGSPLIDRVVARCRAENVPLLCLRSHLKIDCLATEYARLGSAALLLPPRPSRTLVAFAQTLRFGIFYELATAGAMANPTAFLPFAQDPSFRALNARRNARMVEATAYLDERLSARLGTQVIVPHHGCYLILRRSNPTEHRAADLLATLVTKLSAAGLEARPAPSFGYDLVGLTLLRRQGMLVRIAVPDLPDDDLDRLAEIITREMS